MQQTPSKEVALVLSSGGARGYAHIGAIEELEARGYRIRSVAGTSMGALVGGIYCAGALPRFKEWIVGMSASQRLALYDVSVSFTHLLKGESIINAMIRNVTPDRRIEALPLPFRAIATDLRHQREVVFDRGSLYAAIRASISVPTYYSPLRTSDMLLVDGGITNPLPLNRVPRSKGGDDLLVAVNVSAPRDERYDVTRARAQHTRRSTLPAWLGKLLPDAAGSPGNYVSIIRRTINTQIQSHTALSLRITPPDVLASIPMNRFSGNDYQNVEKIIRAGRLQMRRALNDYEARPAASDGDGCKADGSATL